MQVDLVQTTTRDDIRLDGVYHAPTGRAALGVDALCLIHGTGSTFYGSSLLENVAAHLQELGCGVLRANTRGHDWITIAALAKGGGRRQGAAYERVDDCRHDLAAWIDWLRQRAGPRVGLIGHSLGAVKAVYTAAHEAQLGVACVGAVSPPRLSYSFYCQSEKRAEFLADYHRAEELIQAGEGQTLIEVKWPLPIVITAAGYAEKYGPDERYNFLRFAASCRCPTLFTYGSQEVASHMAFQGLPDELTALHSRHPSIQVATVADADHFYTGKRAEVWSALEPWLRTIERTS
jgi:alpha/beta superfamily hydrolase